jgi:phosphoribosylglycinamide formyltransferase-1
LTRIAILVSGHGSNLQALIDGCNSGLIQGSIVGVLTNRPDAYALERAKQAGLRHTVIDHRDYADRQTFEAALTQMLNSWQPDLIVLAGFMRVLTAGFVNRFSGQIVNIHPSLLSSYKGLHTHARVLAAGERFHGCSVHFVTPELDSGAVIAQSLFEVTDRHTADDLAQHVHQLEHQLYPRIVSWIAAGRVALLGNRVYLDGQVMRHSIRFWQHG